MNGTGPMGQGAMTGRGRGNCQSGLKTCRRGFAWNLFSRNTVNSPKDQLEVLEENEKVLMENLEAIKAAKDALINK